MTIYADVPNGAHNTAHAEFTTFTTQMHRIYEIEAGPAHSIIIPANAVCNRPTSVLIPVTEMKLTRLYATLAMSRANHEMATARTRTNFPGSLYTNIKRQGRTCDLSEQV